MNNIIYHYKFIDGQTRLQYIEQNGKKTKPEFITIQRMPDTRPRYICKCGCEILRISLPQHLRSKKHKNLLQKLN